MKYQFRRMWKFALAVSIFAIFAGGMLPSRVTSGCFAKSPNQDHSLQRAPAQQISLPWLKQRANERVLHVETKTFVRDVLQAKMPVLVDFYADWCGPCRALAPKLEEFAREVPEARVVKVNVDKNPELAARLGIRSLPSLMVFKGGKVTSAKVGVPSKKQLQSMLDF